MGSPEVDNDLVRARWIRSVLLVTHDLLAEHTNADAIAPHLHHHWDGDDKMGVEEVALGARNDPADLEAWINARAARVLPGGGRDDANATWAVTWPIHEDNRYVAAYVLVKYRTSEVLLVRSPVSLPDVPPAIQRATGGDGRTRIVSASGPGPSIDAMDWQVVELPPTGQVSPLLALARLLRTRAYPEVGNDYKFDSRAWSAWARGVQALERAEYAVAREAFVEALAIGDPEYRSLAGMGIGDALAMGGSIPEAHIAYKAALAIAAADGDDLTRYFTGLGQACIHLSRGDEAQALAALVEVLPPPSGVGGEREITARIGEVLTPGTRRFQQKVELLRIDLRNTAGLLLGDGFEEQVTPLFHLALRALKTAMQRAAHERMGTGFGIAGLPRHSLKAYLRRSAARTTGEPLLLTERAGMTHTEQDEAARARNSRNHGNQATL